MQSNTDTLAGYEKKRMSEMRGVSVTPTVLSVSLDQVEAIHSECPSVMQRMKSMSMRESGTEDQFSMSPSQRRPLEACLRVTVYHYVYTC